ncbi:phospholipase C/P1 nuclease domain-containing protein [Boletus edulis BED1]|uniref:Phospholipase C/P1 nuclease domain-containing protein n=1 Tax=Boletus edulis BED1 TaxID=1328754 RepID=A0AAD4BET0_BOLED|nr:phospholipase C/P1 nuclease domain-containing protein [Boletus edulis BED1]
MHMSLHLTGRNRGGNDDKVTFDGRTTNLHSVSDTLLISERLRTTIYDPYIRRLVWEGLVGKWQNELDAWLVALSADDDTLCPYAWAEPTHQLNCGFVVPKELDDLAPPYHFAEDTLVIVAGKPMKSPNTELYTPDCAGVIKERWVSAQAGIRLAAVLNWIFAELNVGEARRAYSRS